MIHLESISRRQFLTHLISTAGSAALAGIAFADKVEFPPTRVITRGPRHHWFGYYDKLQFDPTSRYVLGMEVAFEHRSPKADDVIKVGMVDLQDQDRWIELGESSAWNWQQGCMLQWLPGSDSKVIWNDREQGQFVSRILDVKTGKGRTVPAPVYSVSPDGKTAITPDFRRIQFPALERFPGNSRTSNIILIIYCSVRMAPALSHCIAGSTRTANDFPGW